MRFFGGGIRSRERLAPAAFTACFAKAARSFTEATGGGDKPFFPMLHDLFAVDDADDGWLSGFLKEADGNEADSMLAVPRDDARAAFASADRPARLRGGEVAEAFRDAWDQMRAELVVDGQPFVPAGPLAEEAADAFAEGGEHLQRALTKQRETASRRQLDLDINRLAEEDPLRVARSQCDRFSQSNLLTWPTPMLSLSDGAFEDTFAIYFGFPTALVDGRVGETVHAASGPSGSRPLDEHGWALGTVQMAGEAVWRAASRDVQHVLFEAINDAGIPVLSEPRGIFSSVIPPAFLWEPSDGEEVGDDPAAPPAAEGAEWRRGRRRPPQRVAGRQAITPDLAYEPRMHGGGGERRLVLLDLKGLRYSSINYPSAALDFMAARTGRRARTGFRSAVRRREDRVVTDYQRHAREVDRRLAERGYEGGVADYLATFIRDKRLRGVVFGSFNEGSPNMHQLLREVAREQAAARWRQAGARGYADYLSFLTTALYRRWGAAFARANARVRITRLRLVGSRGRRADAVGDGEWDGLGGAGVFAEGNRPL